MKETIGIDEVGRGPVAGPVTLCAVYVKNVNLIKKTIFNNIIRDSKKLSKMNRHRIYKTIRENRYLENELIYSISSRSAKYIDKHGISKAIKSCLVSCINKLSKKGVDVKNISIKLDAGLIIPIDSLTQDSFIKGDEKFAEIALASIIAKETRDKHMKNLSKEFPVYFWEKNSGYGTKEHMKMIKICGYSKHHRLSYLKSFKQLDKSE